MTEVRYSDFEGNEGLLRDFYSPVTKANKNVDTLNSWINTTREKEQQLVDHVVKSGGKVISVHTEAISKRRYKRNVAKLNRKLSKV